LEKDMIEFKNKIQNLSVFKGETATIRTVAYTREADYSSYPETLTDTVKNVTGFTPVFIVKRFKEDTDANKIFQATGTLTTPASGIIDFTITKAQNNISAGQYFYEIIITDTTTRYVLNSGEYNVFESVKDSLT